jgi:hypothetical protein
LLGSATLTGVSISNCDSSQVLNNKISDHVNLGITNTGISLGLGVTNSLVANNQISNLYYTGSGGWSGWGIKVSVGTNANDTIFGNTIAKVGGDGYSSISAGGTAGIYVTSGDSLYFYNNTVNLFGLNKYGAATISGALAFESSVTRVRIQNNIFVNKLINPTNAAGRSMGIIWLGDPINLRKLDLAATLWPINATRSPLCMVQLMPLNASICAPTLDLLRDPPVTERNRAPLRERASLVNTGIFSHTSRSSITGGVVIAKPVLKPALAVVDVQGLTASLERIPAGKAGSKAEDRYTKKSAGFLVPSQHH